MHDLGRTQLESFEYDFEAEGELFNEAETEQLASELMEIQNEQELEQFLGDVIKKAGSAIGGFISSPTGKALGGILKGAAKQALPMVGSALGGMIGGDAGAQMGSKLASFAGDKLGLEMEGELDSAKNFIRMVAEAVKELLAAPPGANPVAAARKAVAVAAEKHMPAASTGTAGRGTAGGTWVRHGNRIILHGV
jgi:hypothetical protein